MPQTWGLWLYSSPDFTLAMTHTRDEINKLNSSMEKSQQNNTNVKQVKKQIKKRNYEKINIDHFYDHLKKRKCFVWKYTNCQIYPMCTIIPQGWSGETTQLRKDKIFSLDEITSKMASKALKQVFLLSELQAPFLWPTQLGKIFSNFSCRFINPNIIFQFE